jgi:hypothetical protein
VSRLSKPAPPHNHLKAPGACMCVDCCQIVLAHRCTATHRNKRCGDHKGHHGDHSLLLCTSFLIAEERVLLDAAGSHLEETQ